MTAARPPLFHWLALVRAPGIGPATALRLLARFGDPDTLFAAGPAAWAQAGLPAALHGGLTRLDEGGIERDLEWLSGDDRHLLTWNDDRYPPLLREIAQPPVALF